MAQKILLVEGSDDEHVLKHICGNHGIPHLDEVKPLCNAERLLENFPVQLKLSGADDVVGVVIDADTDLAARWQAIRYRLTQAGYHDVPVDPDPNGTIVEPPSGASLPRTGVWIMPDNKTTGILEDFLRFLVPQPNALFDHVVTSVGSIPDQRFSRNDKPKATIHTWLAWQSDPGLPYGTAITAHFLNPSLPQANVLVSWLRELFDN